MFKKLKLSTLIFLFVSLVSLVSLLYYRPTGLYNFINASVVFELAFILLFLVVRKRSNVLSIYFTLSIFTYCMYSVIVSQFYGNNHVADFAIIYKSFFYLMMILLCSKSSFISYNRLYSFFRFILVVFFIKYVAWHILGPSYRPGVFTENNFEIPFLLLLYSGIVSDNITVDKWVHIFLFIVVMLSASASGIFAYFIVAIIFLNFSAGKKVFVSLSIIPFFLIFLYYVIMWKISGDDVSLQNVDRIVFFLSFMKATAVWDFWDYMIGAHPITPLSDEVCSELSYYSTLFSYKHDGSCYSNVLHSFILKTLYDHGFLGLVGVLSSLAVALKSSFSSGRLTLSVLAIVIVSAMSISSLNSPFIALAIFMLIGANNERSNCCS